VVQPEETVLLEEVSVPCHEDVTQHSCPFLIPRWLQERMAQSKGQQMQNRDRGVKAFLLFGEFVDSSKGSVLFCKSSLSSS
jgi:hypothetical protein